MKKILRNYIDPYLERLFFYFKKRELRYVEQQKSALLEACQSVGFNVRLNGKNHAISKPQKLILGNNVHIGNNAFFKTEGGLIIGDNTHISRNVTIYTTNHNYNGNALPYDETSTYKPVTIGCNVWIGMNVSIIPGISIGEGAIIGMGTVVNRDIAPFEIIGTPKVINIKDRNQSHYKELNDSKRYGGINGSILSSKDVRNYQKNYEFNRNNKIVFVLSTGRSGSKAITEILNRHPDCKAFHEDISQLIRISTELAYTPHDEKLLNELESIFKVKVWSASSKQVLIHSDQRLWNLVPFLSKYFPNSMFIHLQRKAVPCIKSMVLRDWYLENEYPEIHKHDWAKYRLNGYLLNKFSKEEWSAMTNIDKCCWYYSYINESINKDLRTIDSSRKLFIWLEELDNNFLNIQDFMEIPSFELHSIVSNKIAPKDREKLDRLDIKALTKSIEMALSKFSNNV